MAFAGDEVYAKLLCIIHGAVNSEAGIDKMNNLHLLKLLITIKATLLRSFPRRIVF